MPLDKLHIIIGRERRTVPAQVDYEDNAEVIFGQFVGYTDDDLTMFVNACREGKLYTTFEGKEYKMTELTQDRKFKLELVASI